MGAPVFVGSGPRQCADLFLSVEGLVTAIGVSSGVFLRFRPLGAGRRDWRRAVTEGYEVQIDERGYDPDRKATGSPLHYTGAVYRLAPATAMASRPVGEWNAFQITARGPERSEEHTSELQSLMRISYAVFCLKKKKKQNTAKPQTTRLYKR